MSDIGRPYPHPDIQDVVLTTTAIRRRVRALGEQIAVDYAGRDLHLITILRGGLIFLTDLARAIDHPLSLDTLAVSSYVGQNQGTVRITKDLDDAIEGRHVLLVEDIVDTGLTLTYIRRNLLARDPASLRICTLLDRPYRRDRRPNARLHGLRGPGCVRRRLRTRLAWTLPQSALYWDSQGRILQVELAHPGRVVWLEAHKPCRVRVHPLAERTRGAKRNER